MSQKQKLKDVTLIGLDCVNISRLINVAEMCQNHIEFGQVKLLTSLQCRHKDVVQIRPVLTRKEYSRFCIKELNAFVETDYVLIIQHDGFILNPHGWSDEFMKYDYIGAPWWYEDHQNVGNGGFSLRSKKLLQLLAGDDFISNYDPEDHRIGRTYRDYLEGKGIRYATEAVAGRFSIEKNYKFNARWSGQFGFHSWDTDLSNWKPLQYAGLWSNRGFLKDFYQGKIKLWLYRQRMKQLGKALRKKHKAVGVNPCIFDEYAGHYRDNSGTDLQVLRVGNDLFIRFESLQVMFYPGSETLYFAYDIEAQVTFRKDPAGKVNGLVAHLPNLEIEFKKVE